jgi:hypothetical protein
LNSKTLFVCWRAKSVLNLPEHGNAETCSRAEPIARPAKQFPRRPDLLAGDHFQPFASGGFPDPATALTALNHAPNPS